MPKKPKSPTLPDWLTQLQSTSDTDSGIRWLSAKEIAKVRDEFDEDDDSHLEMYGDIHSYTDEDLRGDAAARMTECLKVGEGAEGGRFVALARSMGTIF